MLGKDQVHYTLTLAYWKGRSETPSACLPFPPFLPSTSNITFHVFVPPFLLLISLCSQVLDRFILCVSSVFLSNVIYSCCFFSILLLTLPHQSPCNTSKNPNSSFLYSSFNICFFTLCSSISKYVCHLRQPFLCLLASLSLLPSSPSIPSHPWPSFGRVSAADQPF